MEGIDKFFKLTERGSTLGTEIRAGTATFVTLCYILAGVPVCLVCCLLQRCALYDRLLRILPSRAPPLPHDATMEPVNARLLSDSGGPCECSEATKADFGAFPRLPLLRCCTPADCTPEHGA